jgi:hypothetical protein
MKRVIAAILIAPLFLQMQASGICDSNALANGCMARLTSGYNFLKNYRIEGSVGGKEVVEHSYVFAKGTQYMITICANGQATDGIVLTIYDADRNRMASSKIDGQYYGSITFPCNATGIYYLQYTFDKSNTYCGGSSMGFKVTSLLRFP